MVVTERDKEFILKSVGWFISRNLSNFRFLTTIQKTMKNTVLIVHPPKLPDWILLVQMGLMDVDVDVGW